MLSKSGLLADANVYRFSSKEWHSNSGLVYYLYRYYDPNLQRWPNRDPIGETYDFNLYRFNYNSPLAFVDPNGEGPTGTIYGAGIGGAIGGAVGVVVGGAGGTFVLPGGGTIAGAAGLGELGVGVGTALGAAVGNAIENLGNVFNPSPPPSQPTVVAPSDFNNSGFPPGYWPGDKGAAAWGAKNGVGAREGKGRFHGIKQKCKGSKPTDKYGVNPDTGDVVDPEGNSVGNLDDVKSK
jgi:RHS repeat-associated protein